jgi:hypothetical protein
VCQQRWIWGEDEKTYVQPDSKIFRSIWVRSWKEPKIKLSGIRRVRDWHQPSIRFSNVKIYFRYFCAIDNKFCNMLAPKRYKAYEDDVDTLLIASVCGIRVPFALFTFCTLEVFTTGFTGT